MRPSPFASALLQPLPPCSVPPDNCQYPSTQHPYRTLHTIICNTIISTLHKLHPTPETHYQYPSHDYPYP